MSQTAKTRIYNVVVLFVIAATAVGIWKHQEISDWLRLRDYQPAVAIASLADNSGMNSEGRKLFYVWHPTLQPKTTFRDHCPGFEASIVLGCYVSGQSLTVLDVTDERLNGVEEVTAAHEMLHVAYERLSSSEKKRIDALLLAQESLLGSGDGRIKETLAAYRQDNADVVNEMHSIFGTELRDLSPELEQYYSRYFKDRKQVVAHANTYASVFVEREQRIAELDKQLESKKQGIDSLKSQIDELNSKIGAERAEMMVLKNSNTQAFNARVDGYNSLVRRYNKLIDQAKNDIEDYNNIIEERNSIALEEKSLMEALGSDQTTL